MQSYKNIKKSTKAGLIICCILTLVTLGNSIFNLIDPKGPVEFQRLIKPLLDLVISLAIIFYALFGYKKPHGNLLRGTYFFFAISLAVHAFLDTVHGIDRDLLYIAAGLMLLASLVVAYVSGRLNRIEKNKKLLIIVGLLLLADALIDTFLGSYSFLFRMLVGHFTPMFTLTALGFAYTARFEEHKSAGIE